MSKREKKGQIKTLSCTQCSLAFRRPQTLYYSYYKQEKMIKQKLLQMSVFLISMVWVSLMHVNAQNLEKHTWKNRILVVKTSDSASEKYQEQIKEFRNADEELKDRKFVLYIMTGDDFESIDYANRELIHAGKTEGKQIGKTLHDQENFEVILIGLDGGVKLQQTEVLRKEALFKIVDAMPMRRNELNRKNE